MAFTLVSDELWERIEPLSPVEPPKPRGGRPRVPNRACPTGIVHVLRTGVPWHFLPAALGGGGAVTCRRRPHDWEDAGVWRRPTKSWARPSAADPRRRGYTPSPAPTRC